MVITMLIDPEGRAMNAAVIVVERKLPAASLLVMGRIQNCVVVTGPLSLCVHKISYSTSETTEEE
jgi:hypothetical protein